MIHKVHALPCLTARRHNHTAGPRHPLAHSGRWLLDHNEAPVGQAQPDASTNSTATAIGGDEAALQSNSTSNSTVNGTSGHHLDTEKIKEKIHEVEELGRHHNKAEVAVAGTLGGLMLAGMIGAAGFLVYRRVQAARSSADMARRKVERNKFFDPEHSLANEL